MSIIILAALGGLAVGAIIGFAITRATHPNAQQKKQLEQKLAQSQQELADYQHQVTSHFMQTSGHVNNLTQQYRDLHEHLAAGAMKLASPEISRQLIDAGYGRLSSAATTLDDSAIPAPPKDYAPKVPGGVLSEDYGLNDEEAVAPPTAVIDAATSEDDEDEDDPTLKVG